MTDRELLELIFMKLGSIEKEMETLKEDVTKLYNIKTSKDNFNNEDITYVFKLDNKIKDLSKQVQENALDIRIIKKILM